MSAHSVITELTNWSPLYILVDSTETSPKAAMRQSDTILVIVNGSRWTLSGVGHGRGYISVYRVNRTRVPCMINSRQNTTWYCFGDGRNQSCSGKPFQCVSLSSGANTVTLSGAALLMWYTCKITNLRECITC